MHQSAAAQQGAAADRPPVCQLDGFPRTFCGRCATMDDTKPGGS